MIDGSKKRNSLVGVEVLSPYVIERRSNCLSFQHFPFDLRDETQFEPIIQHHYFCIILPAININQRSASRKKTSIHKRKF